MKTLWQYSPVVLVKFHYLTQRKFNLWSFITHLHLNLNSSVRLQHISNLSSPLKRNQPANLAEQQVITNPSLWITHANLCTHILLWCYIFKVGKITASVLWRIVRYRGRTKSSCVTPLLRGSAGTVSYNLRFKPEIFPGSCVDSHIWSLYIFTFNSISENFATFFKSLTLQIPG